MAGNIVPSDVIIISDSEGSADETPVRSPKPRKSAMPGEGVVICPQCGQWFSGENRRKSLWEHVRLTVDHEAYRNQKFLEDQQTVADVFGHAARAISQPSSFFGYADGLARAYTNAPSGIFRAFETGVRPVIEGLQSLGSALVGPPGSSSSTLTVRSLSLDPLIAGKPIVQPAEADAKP